MDSYIYVLLDPRNNKKAYIGRSIDPDKRLISHMREKNSGVRKWRWLMELKEQGKKPILKIIENTDTRNDAQRERFWIKEYKSKGYELTNSNSGGGGHAIKRPERPTMTPEEAAQANAEHEAWLAELKNKAEERYAQALILEKERQAQEAILADERQKQALKQAKRNRIKSMIIWPIFWIFFAATVFMIYKGAERVWLLYFQ